MSDGSKKQPKKRAQTAQVGNRGGFKSGFKNSGVNGTFGGYGYIVDPYERADILSKVDCPK